MKEIPLTDGRIVLSTGNEYLYQEVLDDFVNATFINIVTYNISHTTNDNKLFDYLKKTNKDTNVCLITNIPSRFSWYKTSYFKSTARKNIEKYIKKLSPEKYNFNFLPFFCFNNHTKIVMTNNIAYIGSQNFSDPSSSNFEGGLLIKDRMAIEELDKYVKNFLIDKSEQYYEDEYYETKILVSSMLRNLDLERETLFSQAYDLSGHRGDESFYYNQYHDCYDFTTLETLKSIFDELVSICEFIKDAISDIEELFELKYDFADEKIDKINGLIDSFDETIYDSDIYKLFHYDINEEAVSILDTLAFEETLDFYLDKATDEKNEEFNILALDCEIKIEELLKCTDDLQNEFTSFFELFDDLDEHTQKYTVNSSIDNTAV